MPDLSRFIDYRAYVRFGLGGLERLISRRPFEPGEPQFFIIGLPRSGTTLVYQYVAQRLRVAYFPNLVGRFPDFPCAITWLTQRLHRPYRSDFQSHYGKVKGTMAPREAGGFWLRFFSLNEYEEIGRMPNDRAALLRQTIFTIQRIFNGAPFVNKNVKHLLRIPVLATIFPASLFIVVEREFTDVALSILEARRQNPNSSNEWWSVRPAHYERLKILPVQEQIAHQIHDLHQRMLSDLKQLAAQRVIRLTYGEFCQNPENIIADIRARCRKVRYRNEPVEHFEYRQKKAGSVEEETLVKQVRFLFEK